MKHTYITILFTLAITLGATLSVSAQSKPTEGEGLDRHIEVTKEYVPEVDRANKLDFIPAVTDTVPLRPDIEYSITPTLWKGAFDAKLVDPVSIRADKFTPDRPLFVRVGLGYPIQSLLDVYATANINEKNAVGAYLNHYGRWATITNDVDQDKSGSMSFNSFGGYVERHYGRRMLSINVDDNYRFYTPMGYYLTAPIKKNDGSIIYNDISARVTYGDRFTDFSRFNYRLGLYFSSLNNFSSTNQSNLGAFIDAGWRVYDGDLTITGEFLHINTTYDSGVADMVISPVDKYSDWRVVLKPDYVFGFKDLRMNVGVNFVYDNHMNEGMPYIFPNIKVMYDGLKAIVPYAQIDGSLEDGSFKSLSYMNPYVNKYSFVKNPSRYGFKTGGYGTITSAVSYDVFASMNLWHDYIYFANSQTQNGTFYIFNNDVVSVFSLGGRFNWMIVKGLVFNAGMELNATSQSKIGENISANLINKSDNAGIGLPGFKFMADIKYSYKDKFFVSTGVDIIGKRDYAELVFNADQSAVEAVTNATPASVNLKLEVEYKFTKRFNVFVKGDNILNQRIYEFNRYPQLGANVMVGAKIHF